MKLEKVINLKILQIKLYGKNQLFLKQIMKCRAKNLSKQIKIFRLQIPLNWEAA